MKIGWLAATAVGAVVWSGAAPAQVRGISNTEILIGSLIDLSGPIAQYGKNQRDGMQMRVDEANEAGGINGRKVRLLVEDTGYDPRKAVLGAQKLVENDGIFAAVGTLGTPTMMATLPVFLDAKVMHAFPVSSGRAAYEPLSPLKFAFNLTYFDQAKIVVRAMEEKRAGRKWCIMYQDDDFGTEVLAGTEAGLKAKSMTLVEKTSYKRGATDFSSQVARLKASGCDTFMLGTVVRETIGAMAEARKVGFLPDFVTSAAAYSDLIPKLGGAAVEGLVAAHTAATPTADDPSPRVRDWVAKYKAKFKTDPDMFSAYGWSVTNWTLATAEKAGKSLSNESFTAALESSTFTNDIFGFDTATFSPTKHLGSDSSRLSEIKGGKWVVISGYVKPD